MKITQIMLGKGFGGAERYFIDLSRALAVLGHEVQVICHRRFSQLENLEQIDGLNVATVSAWGWWDIVAQKQIRTALAIFRPQIVHAHLARAAHLVGKPCKQLKLPLLVKTHNYVDLKYYRHVDHFITTTSDQQRYLQAQGIEPGRIDVIPNFSSITPVANVNLRSNETLQLMGYGRLVKKKGFHVLLRALKLLINAGHKVRLKIGGEGPEHNNLVRLCEELGLNKQVEFSGWIDDVANFVSNADVFVLPSIDEPFGIAVLEMMALGVPIVSTCTQGPVEILDDRSGWMVEPDNADVLAAAIGAACTDKSAREHRAANALALFKQKYAEGVVVPRIVDLYQSMVARTQIN